MSVEEKATLEAHLKQSQSLREELAQVRGMQDLLKSTAVSSSEDVLAPFFTDRLMKKVGADANARQGASLEEELASLLSWVFRPVAIAGLFLALCLALYNINLSNDYLSDSTTTESILGMPALTTIAIYELDYYATEAETLP